MRGNEKQYAAGKAGKSFVESKKFFSTQLFLTCISLTDLYIACYTTILLEFIKPHTKTKPNYKIINRITDFIVHSILLGSNYWIVTKIYQV